MNVYNNIAAFNVGYGIYSEGTLPGNMGYNAYYLNSGGTFGAGAGFISPQPGNITLDPALVAASDDGNYANDDLSLQGTSPCIDAGNPAAGYSDVDGTRNDMGAYGGVNGSW